jgi:hypothetical protein
VKRGKWGGLHYRYCFIRGGIKVGRTIMHTVRDLPQMTVNGSWLGTKLAAFTVAGGTGDSL